MMCPMEHMGNAIDHHPGHDPGRTPRVAVPLVIDCNNCGMRGTDTCSDCLVTFLCRREEGDAVVIDLAERRALSVLADSGLVPPLRHTGTP